LRRLDELHRKHKGEGRNRGSHLSIENLDLNSDFQKLRLKNENIRNLIDFLKGSSKRMSQQVFEMKKNYANEQNRDIELQGKIMQIGDNDINKLDEEIRKGKEREKKLEQNLKTYCDNPFFKAGAEDRVAYMEKLRDAEKSVLEFQSDLLAIVAEAKDTQDSAALLETKLSKKESEHDKIREDLIEMETRLGQEQKRSGGQFLHNKQELDPVSKSKLTQNLEQRKHQEWEAKKLEEHTKGRPVYVGNA
jgi:chromosome segregation ATPase